MFFFRPQTTPLPSSSFRGFFLGFFVGGFVGVCLLKLLLLGFVVGLFDFFCVCGRYEFGLVMLCYEGGAGCPCLINKEHYLQPS